MNKKWIGIGLGAVVLVGVVFVATKSTREPEKEQPRSSEELQTKPQASTPQIKNPEPQFSSPPQTPVTTSLAVDVEMQRVVDVLKKSYVPGGLPLRIKLQDELNRHWEQNPPSAATILELVSNQSAPEELRIYFAKALANMVKVHAFTDAEVQEAFGDLRAIISDQSEDAGFRADLANILTRVDQKCGGRSGCCAVAFRCSG